MDRPQTLRSLNREEHPHSDPCVQSNPGGFVFARHLVALNCKVLEITSAFVKTALPTLPHFSPIRLRELPGAFFAGAVPPLR